MNKRLKVYNKFTLVIVSLVLMIAPAYIYQYVNTSLNNRSELAYVEHSPIGREGGSVMPASCDSYPDHSTCQCTLGTIITEACTIPNGNGTKDRICIQSSDNLLMLDKPCDNITCDIGYDKVIDSGSSRCEASCTGNQYRVTSHVTECPIMTLIPSGKSFVKYTGVDTAYALNKLLGSNSGCVAVMVASCEECPVGTAPNANHLYCEAPSSPTIHIDLHN